MGTDSGEVASGKRMTLHVDDRGRVTLPKEVRDQLGIESNQEIPAWLRGSVLEVNPQPTADLQTATAGRDSWADTTPADAGESLFGPLDESE
jgi:bifunctional DNA-binding transcriptional regulator/antitoxin component of YhaV-PrlF toxin-antitoxin module